MEKRRDNQQCTAGLAETARSTNSVQQVYSVRQGQSHGVFGRCTAGCTEVQLSVGTVLAPVYYLSLLLVTRILDSVQDSVWSS